MPAPCAGDLPITPDAVVTVKLRGGEEVGRLRSRQSDLVSAVGLVNPASPASPRRMLRTPGRGPRDSGDFSRLSRCLQQDPSRQYGKQSWSGICPVGCSRLDDCLEKGGVPVSRDECEGITKELQSAGQAEMAFPESFDKFLTENLNDRIRKKQDEFDVKKAERKKLHDVQVLKHAEKWRRARLDLQ